MSSNGASPFPAARISPGDQRHFEDLADQMLDRTLRSYDQFLLDRQQPLDDRKRWKEIRRETNAAVYVKRASSQEDSLSSANAAWRGLRDPMVIVGLGRSTGTVEDMLLALAAGTVRDNAISSAYLGRRLSGNAILAELKKPTPEDPFNFVIIQWLAYPAPRILDKIVRTRDFVFMTSKGLTRRENGDVIGYEMMQSVDLPECPSLERPLSYIRGRLALGAIFVQRPDNSVDMFFETFVESNGRLSNKIAQYYTSTALASLFRLDETAKRIKLQWCADAARRSTLDAHRGVSEGRRRLQRSSSSSAMAVNDCVNCSGRLQVSSIVSGHRCQLCQSPMCSLCKLTVELKSVDRELKITTEDVSVCSTCLIHAEATSASEIARDRVQKSEGQSPATKFGLAAVSDTFNHTRSTEDSRSSFGTDDGGGFMY
jgi:hypothetical protein